MALQEEMLESVQLVFPTASVVSCQQVLHKVRKSTEMVTAYFQTSYDVFTLFWDYYPFEEGSSMLLQTHGRKKPERRKISMMISSCYHKKVT